MKHLLYLLLCSVLCCSCDIHSSDNGDLDGLWCLTLVDSLSCGSTVQYRQERVFWAFSAGLMTMRQMPANEHAEYVCHFTRDADILRMDDVYLSDRVVGDRLISPDSIFVLRPLGINALREEFSILQLSASNMTLQSNMLKLHFEKY